MKNLKQVAASDPALQILEQTEPSTIYVARPTLPDLEAFIPYLRKIWHSKILTNGVVGSYCGLCRPCGIRVAIVDQTTTPMEAI